MTAQIPVGRFDEFTFWRYDHAPCIFGCCDCCFDAACLGCCLRLLRHAFLPALLPGSLPAYLPNHDLPNLLQVCSSDLLHHQLQDRYPSSRGTDLRTAVLH